MFHVSSNVRKLQLRRRQERSAMSDQQRRDLKLKRLLRRLFFWKSTGDGEDCTSDAENGHSMNVPQYRLEGARKGKRLGVHTILSCFCGRASTSGGGISHNQRLASTLHWMFRVNFIFLFSVMCMAFFVLVVIFSALIIAAGKKDADCVKIGGNSFGANGSVFADAFSLSWTTFSTVGYGSTYPALGHENNNPTNCLFITVICSLESFIGVLYSGFCGAILFGKVLRIQSHAQVEFSDPIVVRYGIGVDVAEESDDEDEEESTGIPRIPCPVLEFRVVNKLFALTGGEIMDGSLNVVANIDANDVDDADLTTSDRSSPSIGSDTSHSYGLGTDTSRIGTSKRRGSAFSNAKLARGINQLGSGIGTGIGHIGHSINNIGRISGLSGLVGKRDHSFDEDPTAKLVNKRMFSKMLIEASDHPFFKRVWVGRHILDDTSPIVKPKVKRQIRRNGGYWPSRLNNHEGVRDSLQFNQILVSLNGVANVSASDVYAQKIYDFVDINVGYQFVNILYKDNDGSLKVDIDLLNDVREQKGGGGEPLLIGVE
eukprot:scaffold743_cov117-Cylindrotheca_fusiformis.AAC.21